jgi:hypothetical protein
MEDPMTLCPGIGAVGPWYYSSPSAPGGAPDVEQLEVTKSEVWSSWRHSVTPTLLGGNEWRTRPLSTLLLVVPDGGAPDAGEWVDAGVAVAQSWRRVDVD